MKMLLLLQYLLPYNRENQEKKRNPEVKADFFESFDFDASIVTFSNMEKNETHKYRFILLAWLPCPP